MANNLPKQTAIQRITQFVKQKQVEFNKALEDRYFSAKQTPVVKKTTNIGIKTDDDQVLIAELKDKYTLKDPGTANKFYSLMCAIKKGNVQDFSTILFKNYSELHVGKTKIVTKEKQEIGLFTFILNHAPNDNKLDLLKKYFQRIREESGTEFHYENEMKLALKFIGCKFGNDQQNNNSDPNGDKAKVLIALYRDIAEETLDHMLRKIDTKMPQEKLKLYNGFFGENDENITQLSSDLQKSDLEDANVMVEQNGYFASLKKVRMRKIAIHQALQQEQNIKLGNNQDDAQQQQIVTTTNNQDDAQQQQIVTTTNNQDGKLDGKLDNKQDNKHDAPTGDAALNSGQWQHVYLEAEDILEILKQNERYKESILKDGFKEHHCMLNDVNCFIIPEQGTGHGIQGADAMQLPNILGDYANDNLIIIRNFGRNHWVAIKRMITYVDNERMETYTFADSLPVTTANEYNKILNSSDKETKASRDDTIYAKMEQDIKQAKASLSSEMKYVFKDLSSALTQQGNDCGIHAALNAVDMADMALGNADHAKLCTAENVAKLRKEYCTRKAKEASQSAKELLYTTYKVNNTEWKVMAPSPLKEENADSLLMTLLAKIGLYEQDKQQKQFLFKNNDDNKTAYIDKNYNHSIAAKGNYKLQQKIDEHTDIITNALIDAYNEVYGEDKANFEEINKIWQRAQNVEAWKALRANKQNNDDDRKMLEFSAVFQKKMHTAGLMTGNPNATNFVGMRVKRVSPCHIDALRAKLLPEQSAKVELPSLHRIDTKLIRQSSAHLNPLDSLHIEQNTQSQKILSQKSPNIQLSGAVEPRLKTDIIRFRPYSASISKSRHSQPRIDDFENKTIPFKADPSNLQILNPPSNNLLRRQTSKQYLDDLDNVSIRSFTSV